MRTSLKFRVSGSMLAAALCLAAAAPMAHADDATHRAKVEEMMKLTKADSTMAEQLGALRDRVNMLATQQTSGNTATPEQKTVSDAYLKQVQGVTEDEVGWTKLRPLIEQSYSEAFTDAELDTIIAFYKTSAGQTLIAKTPELSGKTMTLVQGRIKDMQPKLAQMTEDYVNKMKATAPATEKPAAAAAAPKAAPAAH